MTEPDHQAVDPCSLLKLVSLIHILEFRSLELATHRAFTDSSSILLGEILEPSDFQPWMHARITFPMGSSDGAVCNNGGGAACRPLQRSG